MRMTRLSTLCLSGMIAAAVWACPTTACADAPVNKTLLGGVAVDGADVVAYFTDGRVEKGVKDFTFTWRGATWRFASAAHRDAFAAAPDKYAPQYGGYCAWAMSQNKKATIDPEAWRIVDGKLYLNYDKDIQAKWERDIPGLVTKADAFWKKMAGP